MTARRESVLASQHTMPKVKLAKPLEGNLTTSCTTAVRCSVLSKGQPPKTAQLITSGVPALLWIQSVAGHTSMSLSCSAVPQGLLIGPKVPYRLESVRLDCASAATHPQCQPASLHDGSTHTLFMASGLHARPFTETPREAVVLDASKQPVMHPTMGCVGCDNH